MIYVFISASGDGSVLLCLWASWLCDSQCCVLSCILPVHMHLQLCCWECCAVPLGQLCLEKVIYVVEAVLVYFSVLILSHIKMQHWCWECLLCLWAGCVCILCAFQFCLVDFAFFPFIILLFLFPTVFLFRMYMLLLWGVYEVVIFKPT